MTDLLGTVAAIVSLVAAGYIMAIIKLRMRVLASGALLTFGIMQLHTGIVAMPAISHITHIAITGCVVYFATVANNFVTIACKLRSPRGASCPKDNVEISTDFPPHNYHERKGTENVVKK